MADETPPKSKLPAGVARVMFATLLVLALAAIYANVQRHRRDKLENVVVRLILPTPTPTPRR